ncbi:MAG: beta-ketoacyl-[acyl-carrier-protein] synthase II, partial [Spirochaetia bacterium]|nr:beta-ketoacyl-[acyl-carrier-protein] synthase II [Spirochaetia bacterium]
MSQRRVVVTGLGTVNPLANNVKDTWDKLIRGESGVRRIKTFDASEYTSQVGGELQDFDFTKHFTAENVNRARKLDPFVHYAQAATHEALAMAGLGKDNTTFPRDRIGICVGSGIGGLHTQIKQTEAYMNKGHKRVSPFYIPALIGNIASGFVSMEEDLRGPNLSTQTACATGNHSIGTAFFILQNGMAEAMVCGGTEATILGICFAGFGNMK